MKNAVGKTLTVLLFTGTLCMSYVARGEFKDGDGSNNLESGLAANHLKHLQDLAQSIANPSVRSYALVEVARAYAAYDRVATTKLLVEAFSLSRVLEPGTGRDFLEETVCNQAILLAPGRLDDFLYQVDADVRRSVLRLLLAQYERSNQIGKALEVIHRLANEDEFPYGDADRIIAKLPGSRAEKQALFVAALNSYKAHKHDTIEPRNDFGLLLVHVWKDIDPASVEEAILYILQEAQPSSSQDSVRISVISAKGSASLASTYDYRLFELLPILSQLDASTARDLLDRYSQTKQLLGRYPDGVLSLDGGNTGGQAVIGVSNGGATLQMESLTWQQELEKARQIVASAAIDPAQAIDNADTLNFPFVKADALEQIAASASRKWPELAKSAIQKATALGPKLVPVERAKHMIAAAELYIAMGDSSDARTVLEAGSDAVKELFKEDSDKEDPNTALKAFWPSAIIWQQLVSVANKISPAASVAIIKSISDQDIQLLALVALESAKMGLPPMPIMTVTTHKAGEITYRPEG